MAPRRHNRSGSRRQRSPPTDAAATPSEPQAAAALAAGHYRDAIAQYKILIKQERRGEWLESLASAYAGRAQELAAKGMYREALALWENRATTCALPTGDAEHLRLLILAGRTQTAVALLSSAPAASRDLEAVRCLLAARALGGDRSALANLPADDPITKDYATAFRAVEAYCGGDDTALTTALTAISYRSPYRDLRPILKALIRLPTDPRGAAHLLARVPVTSAFAPIAKLAVGATQPDPDLHATLRELAATPRAFVAAVRGWPPERLRLFEAIGSNGDSPRTVFRAAVRHRQLLGDNVAERTARRALLHHPALEREYNRAFRPLGAFERARSAALRLELDNREHDFDRYQAWQEALDAIDQPDFPAPNRDLSIALILRHQCQLFGDLDGPLEEERVAALERSLHHDPTDRATHLQLIDYYRNHRRLKDARRLQEAALARWPEDPDVLAATVDTALAGGAFKKAAGLARRILELDPINSRVQRTLLNAHLAHARKQRLAGRSDLALKELTQASEWARSGHSRARIDLLRGLVELDEGKTDSARERIRTATEGLGGHLVGQFELLLETRRLDRHPISEALKQAGLPKLPTRIEREWLLATFHAVNELDKHDLALAADAIEVLEGPLKRGAKAKTLARAELELICETLRRLRLNVLRLHYARAALKRWPDLPVFVFHKIEATCNRTHYLAPDAEDALLTALEHAKDAGDQRTAHRIIELHSDYEDEDPFGLPPLACGEDEPDPGAMFSGLLRAMGQLGGVDGVLELLRTVDDGRVVAALEKAFGRTGLRTRLQAFIDGDAEFPLDERTLGGPGRARASSDSDRDRREGPNPDPDQVELF